MSLPFLSPNRTVLLVTDEALFVYATTPAQVKLMETVPWDADNFERNVASIIAKDCKGRPVLILNDMVEQHYRKERVLKSGVGLLDKSGMIKRKLNVAFPNYPVRAAFSLKEKAPKSEGGKLASDIYIFTAIPDSQQYRKSLGAASKSLATISGFCLLPVESSNMVKTLADKLNKNKAKRPKWTVFIGQHRNGSLRQIVTKDGELALTRMTPILDDDSNIGAWVDDVHQEFKATMSYLSRFGYQHEDGLSVVLIAKKEAGDAFEQTIEEKCNFFTLTASQAASLLKSPIGATENDRYADVLHVGWAGRKTSFILSMGSKDLNKVSTPRRAAMAASVILSLSTIALAYFTFSNVTEISAVNEEIAESSARLTQLEANLASKEQELKERGIDIRLVNSSIDVYGALEQTKINPYQVFKGIGAGLGETWRASAIKIERPQEPQRSGLAILPTGNQESAPSYLTTVQMVYPAQAISSFSPEDIERENQNIEALGGAIQSNLEEGYNVRVTKKLRDTKYVDTVVIGEENSANQRLEQDFIAELVIEGPPVDDGNTR